MKKKELGYTKQNVRINKENILCLQFYADKYRLYQSLRCIKEKKSDYKKGYKKYQTII